MTTDQTVPNAIEELNPELAGIGRYEYGWHDSDTAGATMEWVDGNIGSKLTMKYPAVYLLGEHARGETLSIAMAGEGQHLSLIHI